MIKKKEDIKEVVTEALRDGPGSVKHLDYLVLEDKLGKLKGLSYLTLEKGCGLGVHQHFNEEEIYLFTKGQAIYTDDDKEYVVKAGDVTVCESGHKHGVINNGDEPCEYVAFIVIE